MKGEPGMQKHGRFLPLLGFLFFVLAGCATVQGDWEMAKKGDTVYAYQAFLGNHPDSEFDGQAKARIEEIDWATAVKQGDVHSYAYFKRKHPKSPRVGEAEARMAELEWADARKSDSGGSYAGFLQRYPASPHAGEAAKRLRELRFETARKGESVAAIEGFLKAYPQGEDSETLRRELPAVRVWEPRRILAERIIRLCPKTTLTVTELMEGKTGKQPETYKADLTEIRSLLDRGVDPNAVRIAGWAPATETQGLVFTRGGPVMSKQYNMGSPGNPVPYDKPGMTLLEYCKANGLAEAYEILKSHGAK